jgi:hypothetical protein
MKNLMAPMWFANFLENDSVSRTRRETHCLRGVVEAFDVIRFAGFLRNGFVLGWWNTPL